MTTHDAADLAELVRGFAQAALDAHHASYSGPDAGAVAFAVVMALAVVGVLAALVVAMTRGEGRP